VLSGGSLAEAICGIGAVVLAIVALAGILALIGIASLTLLSVAAIVFGAALLLGAGATASLNCLIIEHHYRAHEVARRVAGTMVSGATGSQVLVGLAAIVLGIIGLAGGYPLTLSLIAFLAVRGRPPAQRWPR
jgi:hypothetical protein